MLDHPHPIQPRALRSKGVLPASDEGSAALAEPAGSGPEPVGQANSSTAVAHEIAPSHPAKGGMPC